MSVRIIPRLDIKGPNLVKGINLEGLRVLGKPEDFAKFYYEQGADELLYIDVVASLYQRNSLIDFVTRTAGEIFMPLTVGGGIRSIDDIRAVLRAGADKVSINTAAIGNPNLITEAAQKFGSSTIVVSIEAIKKPDGTYEAFTDNGREATGVEVFKWAIEAAQRGAGELLITSVDNEGTGKGFDVDLTRQIAQSVEIPVVACGGAGDVKHVSDIVVNGHADAVCLASLLHYHYVHLYSDSDLDNGEGNLEYLRSGRGFSRINPVSLPEVKQFLNNQNIDCRLINYE